MEIPISIIAILLYGIYLTVPIWEDYQFFEYRLPVLNIVVWAISLELAFKFLNGRRRLVAIGITILGLAFSLYRFFNYVVDNVNFIRLPDAYKTIDVLLLIIGLLLISYVLTNKHWNTIPKTILCFLTSFFIVSVIVASFDMIVFALNVLFGLFEGDTLGKLFLSSLSLSYGSLLGIMFLLCWLSTTQKSDVQSEEPHPFWKWLALIMVVFAVINLIILIVYALKILVSGQWTSNLIGRYVLLFGTYSVIAYILSYPNIDRHKKIVRVYALLFAITLFFGLQALYLRIDQYGLTINRFFALVLWAWLLVLTILAVIKVKISHVRILEIMLIFAIISMFTFKVPVYQSLHKRLQNWLETFIVNKEKQPSNEDIRQLESLIMTLCESFGKIDTTYIPTSEETKELKQKLAEPVENTRACWSVMEETLKTLNLPKSYMATLYYQICGYKHEYHYDLMKTENITLGSTMILIDFEKDVSSEGTTWTIRSPDSTSIRVFVDTITMAVELTVLSPSNNELDRFVINLSEKDKLISQCMDGSFIHIGEENKPIVINGSNSGKLLIKEFRFSFQATKSGTVKPLNLNFLGVAVIEKEK